MHTVHIDLDLHYTQSNLSVIEKCPQIHCYLDARFDREAVTVQLDKVGATYPVRVSGTLVDKDAIPPTTALCFASMAWRKNESGTPCLLDAGVSHVTIGEIAQGILRDGTFEKEMHMTMHTVGGLEKGVINLRIKHIKGIKVDNHINSYVSDDSSCVEAISSYINDTIATEQQMTDTFHGTENMRIPYDFSESGIQTTKGTPLPAVAFVMAEVPKTNDLYWKNAFETIMKRDGLSVDEWHRLNVAGKARATILTICYAAQYMDYIGDTVVRDNGRVESCENFGDALAMAGAGDCEDLGEVELQCHNAFISHEFPKDWAMHLEMQNIARNYVPPLSLDVVRGAQVSDQVAHYGAHMNDNFIPIDTFMGWLEKTREGRQLKKTLPATGATPVAGLPFLVGEGTGMYEPFGYDNPLAPIMGYVYRAQSLEAFKKPILHKKGEPGSFFVGSLVGMTDYFYKRGSTAPMSFWYCTRQSDGSYTRGVSYSDMMNDSPNVAIKVHPPLSRKIMGSVQEAVYKRVPPGKLVLSELRTSRGVHSILDKVCASVKSHNRTPGPLHQKVPVYIRPHQLTTASKMIGDFAGMTRVWKVEYEVEHITDKTWGYRMDVYVN